MADKTTTVKASYLETKGRPFPDYEFENQLAAELGAHPDAGIGFGQRDLDWDFPTVETAVEALQKLLKFKRLKSCRLAENVAADGD